MWDTINIGRIMWGSFASCKVSMGSVGILFDPYLPWKWQAFLILSWLKIHHWWNSGNAKDMILITFYLNRICLNKYGAKTEMNEKLYINMSFQSLCTFLWRTPSPSIKAPRISIGRGNIMVEFFSAEIEFNVYEKPCWIDKDLKLTNLKITKLQGCWGLSNDVCGLFQCFCGFLLSLSCDHLWTVITLAFFVMGWESPTIIFLR